MYYFTKKRVLITGAASGIGKLMGRMVLEQGATLIIWDLNPDAIDQTLAALSPLGPVHGFVVDVSDPQAVSQTAARVNAQVGLPHVLVNNAGIVTGNGYFHEQPVTDMQRTLDVNALAPMLVTRAFLPDMLRRNSGHVCTISSSAGFISNPRMAVYASSKWAASGWSDSLRLELRRQRSGIGVTTVTPFYINTGMFHGVQSWIPLLEPGDVAARILRGIERNKAWVSMPWNMHLVRLAQGLLPVRFFDWFIGDVCGIYRTMDGFKGRGPAETDAALRRSSDSSAVGDASTEPQPGVGTAKSTEKHSAL